MGGLGGVPVRFFFFASDQQTNSWLKIRAAILSKGVALLSSLARAVLWSPPPCGPRFLP